MSIFRLISFPLHKIRPSPPVTSRSQTRMALVCSARPRVTQFFTPFQIHFAERVAKKSCTHYFTFCSNCHQFNLGLQSYSELNFWQTKLLIWIMRCQSCLMHHRTKKTVNIALLLYWIREIISLKGFPIFWLNIYVRLTWCVYEYLYNTKCWIIACKKRIFMSTVKGFDARF